MGSRPSLEDWEAWNFSCFALLSVPQGPTYRPESGFHKKPKTPILWPPDAKSPLIGKGSDAGKDGGQKEKGAAEDEMVGWHHQLNRQEFQQTLRDTEGQGSLAHCSPWGRKEFDTTE